MNRKLISLTMAMLLLCPSFCPKIAGHFSDTANLGHQFFIVSDCFHFTYISFL